MKTSLTVFLLLLAAPLFGQEKTAATATPSPVVRAVDAKDIEATLIPEKDTILASEPISVLFKLRNKGTRELGVYWGDPLYFNNSANPLHNFKFKVTDAKGRELPLLPGTQPMITTFTPAEQDKFPAGGEAGVALFLPERVVLDKPGDYTITVTKIVEIRLPADKRSWGLGDLALQTDMTAATKIKVLPADPKKMGAFIDDWGARVVAYGHAATQQEREKNEYEHEGEYHPPVVGTDPWPLEKLTSLHDEREIPWLLRMVLTSRHYSIRWDALRALAEYHNDDKGFNALKSLLDTPADQVVAAPLGIEYTDRKPPADVLREDVIKTICEIKSPASIEYALTFRRDKDRDVRRSVAYMADLDMQPEKSYSILQEFTKDSDKDISDEAKLGLYRACERIKPEEAIPILRELAKDSDKHLADAAKDTLKEREHELKKPSGQKQ